MDNMSLADVAAVTRNTDGFLEGNGIIILILFFLIFGWGGAGFGGGAASNAVTQAELQRGFDTQALMTKLDNVTQSQSASAYENAQLINSVNTNMLNSTANLTQTMNAGFDAMTMGMNNGFNSVNQNINNLAHQMEQCCCSLKTQMLQDKYDAVQNQLNLAEIASANAVQTQNILNALGNYYPNPSVNPYTAFGNCGCNCGA